MPELHYKYTVANEIPFMASNFFWNSELFPKIIAFQNSNKNNTKSFNLLKAEIFLVIMKNVTGRPIIWLMVFMQPYKYIFFSYAEIFNLIGFEYIQKLPNFSSNAKLHASPTTN